MTASGFSKYVLLNQKIWWLNLLTSSHLKTWKKGHRDSTEVGHLPYKGTRPTSLGQTWVQYLVTHMVPRAFQSDYWYRARSTTECGPQIKIQNKMKTWKRTSVDLQISVSCNSLLPFLPGIVSLYFCMWIFKARKIPYCSWVLIYSLCIENSTHNNLLVTGLTLLLHILVASCLNTTVLRFALFFIN